MDRLRPRARKVFSGFTTAELEKLEKLFKEFGEHSLDQRFCQKAARAFSSSAGRAGKPRVKWNEVQDWFQNRREEFPAKADPLRVHPKELTSLPDVTQKLLAHRDDCRPEKADEDCRAIGHPPPTQLKEITHLPDVNKALVDHAEACIPEKIQEASQVRKGEKFSNLSELEFEARSAKDGAWFDVDRFLAHRFLSSGEAEVLVRYAGFSAEYDEWVNVKKAVRERSIPFEHWECYKVKVGDCVLCFQETKDEALYYDAHVVEILRKMHDIRGCRCIFSVRYDHDRTEQERVRLRRLCRIRPLQSSFVMSSNVQQESV
ncbi:hypothetical protein Ancab_022917 [Ancistrocladus abbreviatus]